MAHGLKKCVFKTKKIRSDTHTKDDEIMGLKHVNFPIWGVQFHPESILTKEGKKILANFLKVR